MKHSSSIFFWYLCDVYCVRYFLLDSGSLLVTVVFRFLIRELKMSDVALAQRLLASSRMSSKKPSKPCGSNSAKKPRVKSSHPKTSDMVTSAVKSLKERGGSSLQAIKKYISSNYKVDSEKMAPFIRKYIRSAVTSGALIRTKGKRASGSFKWNSSVEKNVKKVIAKPAAPKPKTKATKSASVKSVTVKNSSFNPRKSLTYINAEKPVRATVNSAKSPTKKPKAPKSESAGTSQPVKRM